MRSPGRADRKDPARPGATQRVPDPMPPSLTRSLRRAAGALLLVLLTFSPARAYVLVGEHVLELMAGALGPPRSLRVELRVRLTGADPDGPRELRQTVRSRPPGRLRAETWGEGYQRLHVSDGERHFTARDGRLQGPGRPPGDLILDLLIPRRRVELARRLSELGVDIGRSALGRFGERVCWVVGSAHPSDEVPQLWVDQATFRPVRLRLPALPGEQGSAPLEFRYSDWQPIDGGAYPRRMEVLSGGALQQELRVEDLAADVSLEAGLFDIEALRARLAATPPSTPAAAPLPSAPGTPPAAP